MADKYKNQIKMSEKTIPGEKRNEDASMKGAAKRLTEKPQRALYKPRSGMTIRRSDPSAGESWRSSKSPSPGPAELQPRNRPNQNRQVEISHNENNDIDFKIKINNPLVHEQQDVNEQLKELTISTDVIDLTVSSNPSSEDKKRIKKPEQPIYVPKQAIQEQKPGKDWSDDRDDSRMDSRDRNRNKKKSKKRSGGGADLRIDKNYDDDKNNGKTENRDVRQGSEPRHLQNSHSRGRGRDTRSMEHGGWAVDNRIGDHGGWSGDRNLSKPPIARRNPAQNIDEIPPRFRKTFLEKQGGVNNTAGNSEENWDGGSLSFTSHHQTGRPQNWTNTVPSSRGRGRGRGKYQEQHFNDRRPGESWNTKWKANDDRKETEINGRLEVDQKTKVETDAKKEIVAVRPEEVDKGQGVRGPIIEEVKKDNNSHKVGKLNWAADCDDIFTYRGPSSFASEPEPKLNELPKNTNLPIPGIIAIHSTPDKKADWSEIAADNGVISRSSSQNSLNQHTFPLPSIPQSRPRDKRKKRGKDRSQSRESLGPSIGPVVPNQRRRDRRTSEESCGRGSSRDRNKGHYGFHGASSRENSRERLDWRRSGSSGVTDTGSAAASSDDKERRDDSWRKSFSEDRTNWRSASNNTNSSKPIPQGNTPQIPVASEAAPPAAVPTVNSYPTRGFVQVHAKQLFDPMNPRRPIMVNALNTRAVVQTNVPEKPSQSAPSLHHGNPGFAYPTTSVSDPSLNRFEHAPPAPNDIYEESLQRNPRHLEKLKGIEAAEMDLYYLLGMAMLTGIQDLWPRIHHARNFLRNLLLDLLCTDLKFCLTDHIENLIWKAAYYKIIEALRNNMVDNPENKDYYRKVLLGIVDEGFQYFEKLIQTLEDTYKFKLDDFLSETAAPEKSGFVGLAVNLAQKLLLCLGDLARYKEETCEGVNFGKAKLYYTKAQLLNPKNGRPYYLLGCLATSAKRKMDAVYFYMRSLMATQPLTTARDSLLMLFEDNRKKLESSARNRVEERVTEKESRESTSLRREIWIHPTGGRRRVHRTTSASASSESRRFDSDDEDLTSLSSVEINRRFSNTYLHVHGKLFNKVGMEKFQDVTIQMLKEFRALLHQHPLPVNSTRFIQLTALNIFSIEHTKLKDPPMEPGYRSAVQVNALIVFLQMLNLLLERTYCLLREHMDQNLNHVHEDLLQILPAVKIACDWLLTHASVWNPPPCCNEYRVGPAGDCWQRLAALANFLEVEKFWKVPTVTKQAEGYVPIRLAEDSALAGFTPLNVCEQEVHFTLADTEMRDAQCAVRLRAIAFFSTEFLCGIEPPVLKVQKEGNRLSYVSAVTSAGPSPVNPAEDDDQSDADLLVESFSEEENDSDDRAVLSSSDLSDNAETKRLLHRKEVLERRHQRQERHKRRVKAILDQNGLSVVIEVRPKYLVPDTNCFIDYLSQLKIIASTTALNSTEPCYILTVPLIVVTELEGLSRGGRDRNMSRMSLKAKAHSMTIGEDARLALEFLKSPARTLASVRCVTPSGKFINSFTPFAVDGESDRNFTNDDKILDTCLSLCKYCTKDEFTKPGEPRRLTREVVLLTEDRHLRVKSLARDVPVREMKDFLDWAGLG